MKKIIPVICTMLALTGCIQAPLQSEPPAAAPPQASKPVPVEPASPVDNLPGWLRDPPLDGELAGIGCVPSQGNRAIDRALALDDARSELARQLSRRAAAMEDVVAASPDAFILPGDTIAYSDDAQRMAQALLSAISPQEAGTFTVEGRESYCVLVTLGDRTTRMLFDDIVDAGATPVGNNLRNALYRVFTTSQR